MSQEPRLINVCTGEVITSTEMFTKKQKINMTFKVQSNVEYSIDIKGVYQIKTDFDAECLGIHVKS